MKCLKELVKKVEVMIYGDGAFKDPIGKIWELADPVVSPGYTKGLEGVPRQSYWFNGSTRNNPTKTYRFNWFIM